MNLKVIACLAGLFSLAGLSARAEDLQSMANRPGEWEVTMSGGMMPVTTHRGCYAGDKSLTELTTANMENCSQRNVNIGRDVATVDAVCSMNGMKVTVHAIVKPTGEDSFHSDSHVQMEGMPSIPGIPSDMRMSLDGHRIGACRPGEKPE